MITVTNTINSKSQWKPMLLSERKTVSMELVFDFDQTQVTPKPLSPVRVTLLLGPQNILLQTATCRAQFLLFSQKETPTQIEPNEEVFSAGTRAILYNKNYPALFSSSINAENLQLNSQNLKILSISMCVHEKEKKANTLVWHRTAVQVQELSKVHIPLEDQSYLKVVKDRRYNLNITFDVGSEIANKVALEEWSPHLYIGNKKFTNFSTQWAVKTEEAISFGEYAFYHQDQELRDVRGHYLMSCSAAEHTMAQVSGIISILFSRQASHLICEYLSPRPEENRKEIESLAKAISNKFDKKFSEAIAGRIYLFIRRCQTLKEEFFKSSITMMPHLSARNVQFNTDGSIFIHFNASTDPLLGKGAFKTVRTALEFNTKKWYAVAEIDNSAAERYRGHRELVPFELLKKAVGSIKLLYAVHQTTSSGPKTYLITELYHKTLADQKNYTLIELRNITAQLISAVTNIHKNKCLHRDLKPENIYLKENYELVVGDIGSVCHFNDKVLKSVYYSSSHITSPEYAKAALIGVGKMLDVTTEKLDIWQLGCMIYNLWRHSSDQQGIHWTEIIGLHDNEFLSHIASLKPAEDLFLQPTNPSSLEYLVWRMLSIDPSKRISSQEIVKFISSVSFANLSPNFPAIKSRIITFKELDQEISKLLIDNFNKFAKIETFLSTKENPINPWPTPQFCIMTRGAGNKKTTIISSLYLSLYRKPGESLPVGVEIMMECPSADIKTASIMESWIFDIVHELSHQFALKSTRLRQNLEELKWISFNIQDIKVPAKYTLDSNNTVAVMLGIVEPITATGIPEFIEQNGHSIRLVTARLLTKDEWALIDQHKQPGRDLLAEKFKKEQTFHLSTIE